ncbi:MAG TPA: hypothetical protein VGI26_00420 [Solirubrobacteraceae bacterium]|jgi:hypothetical protein
MYTKLATILIGLCLPCAVACTPAFGEELEWELNKTPVKETIAVKSKIAETIRIEDMKTPSGAVAVACKGSDEGNVNAGGKGELTKFTMSECTPVTGGCGAGTIKITALHLPWKTQLMEPGEEAFFLDKISSGGTGTPGLKVECTILGIKITDECTGETTHMIEAAPSGINVIFETELAAEAYNCTLGGSAQGLMSGIDLLEDPSGKELAAGFACLAGFPCFELKNPGGIFTKTGEKRTIEVKDIFLTGKPAALTAGAFRAGFFTVNLEELETCRKLTYALNEVCTFEIAYIKKTVTPEPVVRLKILITHGLEPNNELGFSG